MKTLCVAVVVVLSFTSVCQSAPLACQNLLKPVDKAPDLAGRWYLVALSTESCVISALLSFISPTVRADFTLKDKPNIYDLTFYVKVYGHCGNDSQTLFHDNNRLMALDSNHHPTTMTDSLLQTSCSDCFVGQTVNSLHSLMLFSRRQNVNADELSEFVKQTECLKWSRPRVLNTDHDYENCKLLENNAEPHSEATTVLSENVEVLLQEVTNCIIEYFRSWFQSITGYEV